MCEYNKINNQSGQSIVEIIIALAVFVVLAASLASALLVSLTGQERSREAILVEGLLNEAIQAVRAIRNRAWNEIVYNRSAVAVSGNQWSLMGEGTTEQVGQFTRTIDFLPVSRNSGSELVASGTPGSHIDVLSREIVTRVSWLAPSGQIASVTRTMLLGNWNARKWEQADWSGGSGQDEWSDADRYLEDDDNVEIGTVNQITLEEVATSTYATSAYLISSAFNTGDTANFSAIKWEDDWPEDCTGCAVKLQIKTAADSGGSSGAWTSTWSGPDGDDGDESDYYTVATGELIPSDHNGQQWVRYKILITGNSVYTPIVSRIEIYYQL